jgi:hypothetical protein
MRFFTGVHKENDKVYKILAARYFISLSNIFHIVVLNFSLNTPK